MVLRERMWSLYVGGIILVAIGLISVAAYLNTLPEDREFILIAIGPLMAIGGVIMFLFGGTRELTFDKTVGEIDLNVKRLVKSYQKKFPIADALKIAQHINISSSRNNRNRSNSPTVTYHYDLILRDGNSVPLGRVRKNTGFGMTGMATSMAGGRTSPVPSYIHNLTEMLNIELEEDSVGQTAEKVSNISHAANQFLNRR